MSTKYLIKKRFSIYYNSTANGKQRRRRRRTELLIYYSVIRVREGNERRRGVLLLLGYQAFIIKPFASAHHFSAHARLKVLSLSLYLIPLAI